jgi:two-component system CheB/CheR fusion protein
LIVDDNRSSADAMAMILTLEGHQVEAAYDAGDALRADARFRPDVVLIDLTLPDMDGCQLAELLRREEPPPLLIAVSGHDEDEVGVRIRAAGCLRLLVKPVVVEDLLTVLAEAPAREP